MTKFELTWLDGKVTKHETNKSLNELIAEMSVGVGYHIGDCLKSAQEVIQPPQEPKNDDTATQGTGNDGQTGDGGLGATGDAETGGEKAVPDNGNEAQQRDSGNEEGGKVLNAKQTKKRARTADAGEGGAG